MSHLKIKLFPNSITVCDLKADAIVNSTSPKLELTNGQVSKLILQAAGDSIKAECEQIYPNGIDEDSVALTSAGKMHQVDNIIHVTCSQFKDNASAHKVPVTKFV